MKLTLAFAIAMLTTVVPAHAESIEVDDVLAIMAKVPNECGLYRSCKWCAPEDEACQLGAAGFERTPDAREIATAIAAGTSSREETVLGVVYAAYESGNHKCAHGDGGKALGTWQMQRSPSAIACTPALAFSHFLARAHRSMAHCDGSMAEYVSGNCDHGTIKAGKRAELVARLMVQE